MLLMNRPGICSVCHYQIESPPPPPFNPINMKAGGHFGSRGLSAIVSCFAAFWWSGQAQPIIYQATGTKDQIQPVIDQFEHDIVFGSGSNTQNPPSVLGSFKVATFDDISPGTNGVESSETSSGGLQIVANPGGSVYVTANLPAFSPSNCLTIRTVASLGVHPIAVFEPLSPSGLGTWENAIGAVFVNVTASRSASVGFGGGPTYDAPATGASTFSFIGIIQKVQSGPGVIQMGGLGQPFSGPPPNDMVAVDNIILGHTSDIPEPSSGALLTIGVLTSIAWRQRCSGTSSRAISSRLTLPVQVPRVSGT
jgi:hypothetical protein